MIAKKNTTIYFLLAAAIFFLFSQTVSAQQKSLAEARLLVNSFSFEKDPIISLGVLINLQKDWHIYWRNPGDSGLPTDVELILPEGITASEIKFPFPETFTSDEIVNYGYENQVLFLFDLNVPQNYSLKELNISAKITSLLCKEMCKAFDTTVTITLDISKENIAEEKISKLFESTKKMIPAENQNLNIIAESKSDLVYVRIFVNQNENQNIKDIRFYPYNEGVFRNLVKQNILKKEKYFEIVLEPDQFRIKEPTSVDGIIIIEEEIEENQSNKAYEMTVPIVELK
jgi:thiol:disulfide interchange protein DsbD